MRLPVHMLLRSLARDRGFSIAVVATLAMGIAANTMVFSIYEAVVRGALPFRNPQRLVSIWLQDPGQGQERERVSYADFEDWRGQARSLEAVAAMTQTLSTLTDAAAPEQVYGSPITGGFFDLLGVNPVIGRTFSREEAAEGDKVVILGHRIWRERYGGDRRILGKSVDLSGDPHAVIGVMPAGFRYPEWAEYWIPLQSLQGFPTERGARWLLAVARLAPGADLGAAGAELAAIGERNARLYPETSAGYRVRTSSLVRDLVGDLRPFLLVLFGASGLLVLIACVNVTNLMLIRAVTRERESAIRASLGASRGSLTRHFWAEALILGLLGGAAGLAIAHGGLRLLIAFHPADLPRLASARLNFGSVLFAVLLGLGAAALAGLGPTVRTWRRNLVGALHEGAAVSTEGPRLRRLRSAFVVAQVALSAILLVGTGLMAKDLRRAFETDTGYSEENLLTLTIQLPLTGYSEQSQKARFFPTALERLEALPRVRSAGATSALVGEVPVLYPFRVLASDVPPDAIALVSAEAVTPGYFRTMGLPVVAGRAITEQDRPGTRRVAVINETMARRFWPGSDPVGAQVAFWDSFYGRHPPESGVASRTVVGVVKDSRRFGYLSPPGPEIYVPFAQHIRGSMALVLQTTGRPEDLAQAARSAIWELDPDMPIRAVRTMETILADPLSRHLLNLILSALFACGGAGLATIGLYGVVAYSVARGRREVGIRAVLGARPGALFRRVVGQTATLVLPGLVLGLGGGWLVGGLLSTQLASVSPADPWVLAGVSLFLAAISAPAACIPAWKAVRTDPLIVLRHD